MPDDPAAHDPAAHDPAAENRAANEADDELTSDASHMSPGELPRGYAELELDDTPHEPALGVAAPETRPGDGPIISLVGRGFGRGRAMLSRLWGRLGS